jgi:hypothetical protein
VLSNRKLNRRLDCEILFQISRSSANRLLPSVIRVCQSKKSSDNKKLLLLLNLATPAVREVKGHSRVRVFQHTESSNAHSAVE